jgi:hypothetical protein
MRGLGAHVEDPADLPCGKVDVFTVGRQIISHEFREIFDAYLGSLSNCKIKSLEELVK